MWFNGPIAKAVEKTRAEKTMLLVFVCGNDENSILMQKNLEDNIFQDVCQKENCVALKLEDKSEATKQFTEFYPLNNVPTVYFIGSNGKSLEVISDLATIDQIRESFLKAIQSHEHMKSGQMPTTSTGGVPYENVENASQNVLEEKLALAQELIKQKREEKAKQDEEDEKAKEVKRREEGKMVNKAREQHRDQEILAAAAERKRDKKNDKEHLDKIRQQIAADRAEKSQSYQAQKNVELQTKKEHLEKQSQEDAEKARLEQLDRCKRARIQFRLPDGSAFNETFDAELPFFDAVRFAENRVPNLAPFQLIQMFPRREFTGEEIAKSFKDLQLVPSIVLMILPNSRKIGDNSQGWLRRVVSFVTQPFSVVLNWLQMFMFGQPVRGTQRSVTSAGTSNASLDRNFGTQEGNIRRMPGDADDSKKADDDNATWNGNSTQQL